MVKGAGVVRLRRPSCELMMPVWKLSRKGIAEIGKTMWKGLWVKSDGWRSEKASH